MMVGKAGIASLEQGRTMLVESVGPLGIFTALNVPDRRGPNLPPTPKT